MNSPKWRSKLDIDERHIKHNSIAYEYAAYMLPNKIILKNLITKSYKIIVLKYTCFWLYNKTISHLITYMFRLCMFQT